MSNVFELSFEDKTISNLTGNKYGRTIFESQIKPDIVYGKPITIIFPKYIDNIASSFIQGFFDEMVGEIGVHGIEQDVEICSDTIENIKKYILKKLVL